MVEQSPFSLIFITAEVFVRNVFFLLKDGRERGCLKNPLLSAELLLSVFLYGLIAGIIIEVSHNDYLRVSADPEQAVCYFLQSLCG